MNANEMGRIKEMTNACTVKSRHRCEDNIKIDLKGIYCEDVDWIHLALNIIQNLTVVKIVMKLRVPLNIRHVLAAAEQPVASGQGRRTTYVAPSI
jgi:hypothetical protein